LKLMQVTPNEVSAILHTAARVVLCGVAGQLRELFEMGGPLKALTARAKTRWPVCDDLRPH